MSDYIKREDAIKKVRAFVGLNEDERQWAIEDIPSADVVEVRHGRWKVVNDGYGDNAYICECSECKNTVWVYKDADRKWNYCPNCGARMDGEEQEHGDNSNE